MAAVPDDNEHSWTQISSADYKLIRFQFGPDTATQQNADVDTEFRPDDLKTASK